MKIDPYNHEEKYKKWKEKVLIEGVPNISKKNSDLILRYVTDMEHGLNVSQKSVKGCRSFIRLNTLREKMYFFAKKFKEIYNLDDITEITENQLVLFFSKMRKGEIARNDGKMYQSVNYFVKIIKAFWHWWQIVNKKQGKEIPDIATDLDSRGEKPHWVYLTEEQIKKLCNKARWDYKVLIMFLFDTGIRSPTELVNVKVSDFYGDFKELMIREEISKTFGRKIKLMLCFQHIKEYVLEKELSQEDYLFSIKPATVNKYLQRLAERVLGDKVSLAGEKYSELTMYDFRHCSCCYWLPRYKSESALKYRFGWKKSDKIHYYSELLGMKDTITQDDLVLAEEKTELEKNLQQSSRDKQILDDRMKAIEEKVDRFMETLIRLDQVIEKL
ncbi:Phage integrase family protein [uncultured archaeon]|nr:Phage integrase family protein [uncultured archaeon]